MRIGIVTVFRPAVGGTETLAAFLATGLQHLGHDVVVITRTPGPEEPPEPRLRVVRRPGFRALLRLMRGFDVVVQMGVTLRAGWAALVCGVPVVISHQTWLSDRARGFDVRRALKWAYCRFATNVAISRAIASELGGRSTIIPNCYDARVFNLAASPARARDIIFVGRLVSDKGVDLLVEALGLLRAEGLAPSVTLVGDGPERAAIEQSARDRHLGDRISLVGRMAPAEIAALLKQHRVLVVPSRWREPFGVVALEGIACGCHAVVSSDGGLEEIVGDFGTVFSRGDARALAAALRSALDRDETATPAPERRHAHLAEFFVDRFVHRYLDVLRQATQS
jgi:glycosyltransferase involved in cell wall biosynthesis